MKSFGYIRPPRRNPIHLRPMNAGRRHLFVRLEAIDASMANNECRNIIASSFNGRPPTPTPSVVGGPSLRFLTKYQQNQTTFYSVTTLRPLVMRSSFFPLTRNKIRPLFCTFFGGIRHPRNAPPHPIGKAKFLCIVPKLIFIRNILNPPEADENN